MNVFDLRKAPLSGKHLIEASAGTGKTYSITGIYLRLIIEKGYMPDRILVVTFTNAATAELKGRVRDAINETIDILKSSKKPQSTFEEFLAEKHLNDKKAISRLQRALKGFDEAMISTIHGFCNRILGEFAFESGARMDTELIENDRDLKMEIVQDFWRKKITNAPLAIYEKLEKKTSPKKLFAIANNLPLDKGLEVVNPHDSNMNVDEQIAKISEIFDKLKKIWQKDKDGISEKIHDKGLNQRSYKKADEHMENMDLLIAGSIPSLDDKKLDKVKYFRQSIITKSKKKSADYPLEHRFFALFEEYCDLAQSLTGGIIQYRQRFIDYYRKELKKRKSEYNIYTFDDLLVSLRDALAKDKSGQLSEALKKRYKAVLIDEFQDTDPVQFDIFDMAFGGENTLVYYIGDPKQSIYQFRGADIFAYKKALEKLSNIYSMKTNYRSSKDFIDALNILYNNNQNPFIFEWIGYETVDAKGHSENLKIAGKKQNPIDIEVLDTGEKGTSVPVASDIIQSRIVREINRLMNPENPAMIGDSRLELDRIAILVPTNRLADAMKDYLSRYNIPAITSSSNNIFKSEEAEQIFEILNAIAHPQDEKLIKRALITDIIGLNANDIYRINNDEMAVINYVNRFRILNNIWKSYGIFSLFEKLLSISFDYDFKDDRFEALPDIRTRNLAMQNSGRRMTNILHVGEILHNHQKQHFMNIEQIIKYLKDNIELDEEQGSFENEIRLETDEKAVKIISIHKSKGLEFDIVFCPFLWSLKPKFPYDFFSYHDPERDNNITFVLDNNKELQGYDIAMKETKAEMSRMLYVAITRAKYKLYIHHVGNSSKKDNLLQYLLHGKEGYPNIEDLVRLQTESNSLIRYRVVEEQDENTPFIRESDEVQNLQAREFTRNIGDIMRIASYSYISTGSHRYDQFESIDEYESITQDKEKEANKKASLPEDSILKFPAGPIAGQMMHEIFEHSDFMDITNVNQIITNMLHKYGYKTDNNDYIKALGDMFRNVISTHLPSETSFKLSDISKQDRIDEMEFFYPMEGFDINTLRDAFKAGKGKIYRNYLEYLDELSFSKINGFMHGFIDLTFRHNGKYYIIDWKSNRLGYEKEKYRELFTPMAESHYILQYHIYTAALLLYLENNIDGFSYEDDFGGIFYVFIRMVSPEYQNGTGIFHHKPEKPVIDLIKGGS